MQIRSHYFHLFGPLLAPVELRCWSLVNFPQFKTKNLHSFSFGYRVIITEAYSPSLDKVAGYYGKGDTQGTQLSVNYEIMNKFGPASNAKDLESVVNTYIKSLPAGKWSSWMVS